MHAGADPLGVDDMDRSAVDIAWKAALSGNKLAQGLEVLLAQSSSHDYAEKFNLSLLHRTVLGLARIDMKTLVKSASVSEIEDEDEDGQTPLHWAALRGTIKHSRSSSKQGPMSTHAISMVQAF